MAEWSLRPELPILRCKKNSFLCEGGLAIVNYHLLTDSGQIVRFSGRKSVGR